MGVLALMAGATVLVPVLGRLRPQEDLAGYRARVKAWWTMAVVFVVVNLLNSSLSLAGFALLSWLALREYLKRVEDLPASLRYICYAAVPLQYYWIYLRWYGMFIVFIPVFYFLYVPTRLAISRESLRQAALVQWGLMATVFCVSHAAFLLVIDTPPAGGAGLMLYVMFLTEMGEALRLLAPAGNPRLLTVLALSTVAAWGLAPYITPLTLQHALLSGFVIGLGGEIGSHRLQELRLALDLQDGPLRPGQGGGLIRIIGLTYTAPLFLHGFRYFYQ